MSDLGDRFWSKVDKGGPVPEHRPDLGQCWLWKKALARGYATYSPVNEHRGLRLVAHRLLYEHLNGPVGTLQLDHLCRVRHCVNPDHLEPVTAKENVRRSASPMGENARKTHCDYGHEFDAANTRHGIRDGRSIRSCRICTRRRKAEAKERKAAIR